MARESRSWRREMLDSIAYIASININMTPNVIVIC